jgi:hypothetical protein
MRDAYERRALLLHLGDVLDAVNRLMLCSAGADTQTVQEAIDANQSLDGLPLLMHVSPSMSTRDFVARAVAAFLSWPKELLELKLDREQLARTVQQALFAGNAPGWHGYVAALRESVAWFGEGVEPMTANRSAEADTGGETEQRDPPARDVGERRPDGGDIERDGAGQAAPSRASVENERGFYPSWPWKPEV